MSPTEARPGMSQRCDDAAIYGPGERLENAIGSGCEDNVSKVDGICVCWKTLKEDYTLNIKVKLLFFLG